MKLILENWRKYIFDSHHNYRILNETAFSRIVTDYGEGGYIVITSDRTCEAEKGAECSEEEEVLQSRSNALNMKGLQSDLRASGFGYLPTLGGYKEDLVDPKTGETTKVDTEEPENSVIVVARPSKGERFDHEGLKNLGMELSIKYGQDSFFYKPPDDINKGAYWLLPDGSVDLKFDTFTINDLNQEFYTQMVRGPRHRFTAVMKEELKREIVFRVRTSPTSAREARQRYGEVFLKFEK